MDWNSQENAEVWRKAWADLANEFLERNNRPSALTTRSYERQGNRPNPHRSYRRGSVTDGEKRNCYRARRTERSIKAANRLLRDIKAQIGKLKEWLLDVFKAKSLCAEPPQPKSPSSPRCCSALWIFRKANGRSIPKLAATALRRRTQSHFQSCQSSFRKKVSIRWKNWIQPYP